MRARQINSYYNSLGQGIGAIVPPQVTSVSNKSLSIAFQEIAEHRATYHRPTPEELAAELAEVESPTSSTTTCCSPTRSRSGPGGLRTPAERPAAPPRVVLGVAGGIAAYKAVEVCRRLTTRAARSPRCSPRPRRVRRAR